MISGESLKALKSQNETEHATRASVIGEEISRGTQAELCICSSLRKSVLRYGERFGCKIATGRIDNDKAIREDGPSTFCMQGRSAPCPGNKAPVSLKFSSQGWIAAVRMVGAGS